MVFVSDIEPPLIATFILLLLDALQPRIKPGFAADPVSLLPGYKFDEAIQTYVRRKFGVVIGESTAELIKLQVGCATLNCKKNLNLMSLEEETLQKEFLNLLFFKKKTDLELLKTKHLQSLGQ